jgi:hypothetical protein
MKTTLMMALLMVTISFAKAQTANKISSAQKALLINQWFESPRESSGDTLTYKLVKHIHQPGVDNPAMSYSEITFQDGNQFTDNYWRWCKSESAYFGKWTMVGSVIKMDFGRQKCKCELTILDIQRDKLKVIIKETL